MVHRGEDAGIGNWPAVIPRPQWEFTQELLQFRSTAAQSEQGPRPQRTYILRGLIVCGRRGTALSGNSGRVYRCTRKPVSYQAKIIFRKFGFYGVLAPQKPNVRS